MRARFSLSAAILALAIAPAARAAEDTDSADTLPQFVFGYWPGMIFWLLLSFGVLYFVLSRSLLPRIGTVIEDRRDKIEDDLDEANRLNRQAADAERAYNRALADARAQAQAIAAEVRAEVDAEIKRESAAAEAGFAERAAAAETRIREASEAALANVRAIAGEAASSIVERLTGAAPAAEDVNAAVTSVRENGSRN